jgi:hypothetical protein
MFIKKQSYKDEKGHLFDVYKKQSYKDEKGHLFDVYKKNRVTKMRKATSLMFIKKTELQRTL